MAYRVEIAKTAEAELEELSLWVVARAPQQGVKWFNGLERRQRRSTHRDVVTPALTSATPECATA